MIWGRSRDHQQSATVADLFDEAGLAHDPELLIHYREFWEPHTATDPQVAPLFSLLRSRGIAVGVLSNTIWPRAWHEDFFRRDGVLELIDGAVYTSEVPWTKPAPEAFRAAMDAVGASDPSRCVYVGDRLYDDIWGAHNAGLRAIHVPHSDIPAEQVGHSEGTPTPWPTSSPTYRGCWSACNAGFVPVSVLPGGASGAVTPRYMRAPGHAQPDAPPVKFQAARRRAGQV